MPVVYLSKLIIPWVDKAVGKVVSRRRGGEDGASGVEYGLLVAAIAAIIVVVVFVLGRWVLDAFTDTCTSMGGGPADDNCEEPPAG
ncbi:MAG TPA: Flp family type IVb pilin [Actinomycetes bacterium]|jgi:pilus assembly protein Flp/PilA|nr:Flp family type IVb pilin [Actinomycetes bacterium]